MTSPSSPGKRRERAPGAPLAGYRVISLAEQYPGPMATMLLADMGADVILVERPNGGDPTRRFSGHFEALNRNKRSIAVDLKADEGRDLFMRLVSTSDVVVDGFRPGVMARLGLGADELRREYPGLICASISSFGHSGPLSSRGGHDLSMQGMAGFVTDEQPAPLPLADIAAAMFATIGIVTGMLAKERDGSGANVDVAMLDALVTWRATTIVSALNGLDPAPYPPDDPGYGVFGVGTGSELITLSIAGEDHQWRSLCDELGLPSLADLDVVARESQASAIAAQLQDVLRHADPTEIEDRLSERGVGVGHVNDAVSVAKEQQVIAREMIVGVETHPELRVVRQPILFDGIRAPVRVPAPRLGEHSREVLSDIGYTKPNIDALLSAGVVYETGERR